MISIESNWYFPPGSIDQKFFSHSDEHTTCFWKGEASYYDVSAGGSTSKGAAWYYPEPMAGSTEKVGHDFTDYVAFWRGVTITD